MLHMLTPRRDYLFGFIRFWCINQGGTWLLLGVQSREEEDIQTDRQAGRGSEGRIADETGRNSVKLQNIYRRKQNAAIVGYWITNKFNWFPTIGTTASFPEIPFAICTFPLGGGLHVMDVGERKRKSKAAGNNWMKWWIQDENPLICGEQLAGINDRNWVCIGNSDKTTSYEDRANRIQWIIVWDRKGYHGAFNNNQITRRLHCDCFIVF